MTSPLQVLFFFAVALAPAGTHHVTVSGGNEVYGWDKGDALDDVNTWVFHRDTTDPMNVLATNDITPADFTRAQKETLKSIHQKDTGVSNLYFDSGHELQKTPLGYVYIVRPGATNEKFYSFTFK
jgi:hypothetical protein